MDEKQYNLELGERAEKTGFFWIFSKYWLPFIGGLILIGLGLGALYFLAQQTGLIR